MKHIQTIETRNLCQSAKNGGAAGFDPNAGAAGSGNNGGSNSSNGSDDGVVDADYEVVDN